MPNHRVIILLAAVLLTASVASADQFIMPTPQKAVYHEAFLPLRDVRIVTSDKPSRQIEFGVMQLSTHIPAVRVEKYSEYARDPIHPAMTIMIGIRKDSFLPATPPGKWQTEEGYTISTRGDTVICRGYDDRGAYYGVQSLIQLISARGLRLADIQDWPAFKMRILPNAAWSGPEYMEWAAQYKLNVAGIHYPNAKQWRKLPDDYLAKSDAACRFAKETGVIDAIQYLNPYVTYPGSSPVINLENQADFDDLVATYDHFLSTGGTMIALCVDDFFRMTPEDKKRFESHSEAQAFLVNQVYAPLQKRHPGMTMVFCPQWYAGVLQDREKHVELADQSVNFGKDLGRHYWYLCSHIPKDVMVFWTGPKVRSHELTVDQLVSFAKVAGRKPLLWDNTFYDFHPTSFIENLFDPYPFTNKYPADLYEYLDRRAIHLNSGYDQVSKVGFLTAADYFWNPEAFDAEKSLRNALNRVAGPEAAPLMIEFRDTSVDLYMAIKAADLSRKAEVMAKFDHLRALMARIRRTCPNKPLVEELEKHWIGDTQARIDRLFPKD